VATFFGSLGVGAGLAIPLLERASDPAGAGAHGLPRGAVLLLVLGILVVLGGSVVTLTGQSVACTRPAVAPARPWALSSLALGVISRLLGGFALVLFALTLIAAEGAPVPVGGRFLERLWRAAEPVPFPGLFGCMGVAGGLAGLAEVVYLACYLRALAQGCGEERLARRVVEYIRFLVTFLIMLVVGSALLVPLLALLPGEPEFKTGLVRVAVVGGLICLLILFAQFIGLVRDTRDAIARGNAPGPGGQPALPGR
jgi:hypothetical protein